MKVLVKNTFRDVNNFSRIYSPGEVIDVEEGRAKRIVELNLGEFVKESPAPVKPEPKPAPKAEKVEEVKEEVKAEEKPKAKPRKKKE